ncbi:CAP domain-containing protein [Acrocarpospora catenulata]|uniref:CAP domain-containing protein n=1 Tax=Acrocarpospora catenulata TaxID=2836182 RepID=UPI001BDA904B|nr:CAP domain-containing protein [Acrocarpospora catenulata]
MTAVLLLGIVIGRLTVAPRDLDEVYLRNSEPSPSATSPSPPPLALKQRYRPPLDPVARPATTQDAQVPGQTAPSAKPRPRQSNMIPGYDGNSDPTQTHTVPETGVDQSHLARLESNVVALVNAERAKKNNCQPLRVDHRLVQSARTHSIEMAATNSFVHESPDGSTPWQRMERAGYPHGGAENIARGYQTAEQAVAGWMASPTHRNNILNCRLTATGVGVSLGPEGPWWTQDFGYP